MPRIRTRGSPVQEPEDSAYEPGSPSSITVSAAPLKRRRGRPRKNILRSKKPRTALAHRVSDPANISTSNAITATPSSGRLRPLRSPAPTDPTAADIVEPGKKRKRDFSEDVRRTSLQTACGGCKRRSYPHGENWEQDIVTICHRCNKEWHAQCMTRKGIQPVGGVGQWECRDCSIKKKRQPLQPAHMDNTEAEVAPDRQSRDTSRETDLGVLSLSTSIVMEELDTPRITGYSGDLVNVSKITVVQAQNAYEEARGLKENVLTERETCRERLSKLRSEIELYGNGLEEYRRQLHSDGVLPGDGESEHSIIHRLALGISGDGDWTGKISAKIDLMRAEERRLTRRLKSLRDDVKIKKATLERVKQQLSMLSTCIENSCREFEKLRSKVIMDYIEDSPEDSGSSSDSTTGDSTEDIPPTRIARGIERLSEGANQQMKNSKSNEERGQMRALSRLSVEGSDQSISAEVVESRSQIIVLKYAPATEVARASNIDCVSAHLEKSDEGEIRGSSQPLETDGVRGQPHLLKTAEAIRVLQGLPQTLEQVKSPKGYDTANATSRQESLPQPSNITINLPSSDGEGRNQSIFKEPDQSRTPENSLRTQDPYSLTFVSIPTALGPSSKDFVGSNSSEPATIPVPEDPRTITGDSNSEEPYSHRSIDGTALPAEKQDVRADVINQRPEHQHSMPAEADPTATGSGYNNVFRSEHPPAVVGPSCCSQSSASLMRNNIVLPPIASFAATQDALQSSALLSPLPPINLQTPVRDLTLSKAVSEAVPEAGTRSHFVISWNPSSSFQSYLTTSLAYSEDKEEIPTRAGAITRGDLRTLVPKAGYLLADAIINKYLNCLTQHTNARRESDIPDSCSKIAMIGSKDPIPLGLLKNLASFFAIYIPIKIPNNHWVLAVLYPGSSGQRGRSEVYDSHMHWTRNIMTTKDVSFFLNFRLGDEYSPGDWTQSTQQRSRPQQSDADSGLYVLANAKSTALKLERMALDSPALSISLRWQFAQELVTQSIVEAF
ncbi:hypothetical protein V494_01839 [Pseudogymnoascus sp. VKM F-4513 (FW-928)]|nr:hypothetical protein V490_02534 [Pseudogymnoascus sp. VKM F-3557]KFY43705.1 hypothetical protein V494_01839 [Pseudogymnoascus sp. VKM F-4513 (FW-928)]